ncbi:MAG: hypothetical protein FWE70_04215, partial [Oscillospiraceae bacterium]|nr:hypothetical protein [Oscillospiraceae bacterium]
MLGLGIDTGGTYTDAVIYDLEGGGVLCKAKSPTTRGDLLVGIMGALGGLDEGLLGRCGYAAISTTLATNACVEGKGDPARLIMIGCDRGVYGKYGGEYGLPPASEVTFLDGGHAQSGDVVSEPDWGRLEREADAAGVGSFAVVELWGIKDPAFERKAASLLARRPGRTVICGHELTDEVNSLRRAASALLNAELAPMMGGFMAKVGEALAKVGLPLSPLMVRGDGTVMSMSFAAAHPVETLLSGPAASVAGAAALAGVGEAVIVDMGGTTTDIAMVKGGSPAFGAGGATVGRWRTGIRSVRVRTFGLGGDSRVLPRGCGHRASPLGEGGFSRDHGDRMLAGRLSVGPVRVIPLCRLAEDHPGAGARLAGMAGAPGGVKVHTEPYWEFLVGVGDGKGIPGLTDEEARILDALRDGPLCLFDLAEAVGSEVYGLRTGRLERHGAIMRSGFTPTDAANAARPLGVGDAAASGHAARVVAENMGVGVDGLCRDMHEAVCNMLYGYVATVLLEDGHEGLADCGMAPQSAYLVSSSYLGGPLRVASDRAIVGIGAPAHMYVPEVAAAMGCAASLHAHSDVANAVGAVTTKVTAEAAATV